MIARGGGIEELVEPENELVHSFDRRDLDLLFFDFEPCVSDFLLNFLDLFFGLFNFFVISFSSFTPSSLFFRFLNLKVFDLQFGGGKLITLDQSVPELGHSDWDVNSHPVLASLPPLHP